MISRSIRLFSDEELKEQRERKEDALRRILYEEYDSKIKDYKIIMLKN